MKTIKLNEMNAALEVSVQEAADVKGGPIYYREADIKGDVQNSSSGVVVRGWGSSQYQYSVEG